MKRIINVGLLAVSACILLTGCHIKHEWQEATCTEPKTCVVGGETEGEALGHTWVEATCTEPKTCSVCGETEGTVLEHQLDSEGVCNLCGESLGVDIAKDNYRNYLNVEYEWIWYEDALGEYAPIDSDGYHYVECRITVSPIKDGKYENTEITYNINLKDGYAGDRHCFEDGDTTGRLFVDENGYGYEEVIITAVKKDPFLKYSANPAYFAPKMTFDIYAFTGRYIK